MDSGLDSSSSAQAAAAPPSSSESDERRSEPQRQDAGKQGDSSSSRIDLTAAGLTKAATRSALSGGLSARAVLDLMLLPLRLIGLPSSLHPASLLPSMLALGPVPEHIAFIMDGNRRFANASSMSIREGHMSGFQALKRILEACLKLQGVKCVTVYAFAIDNFKRDPGEVEALMHLAKTRLLEMSGHG
jgi:Putative undecaprenyl diphosphate synthase